MRTPVFVICHDRLSLLRELVEWLELAGCDEIHLVDNGSTYEPLLNYLETSPHSVTYLANLGNESPWEAGLIERYAAGRRYVVSDFDVLPEPTCPLDAIEYLGSLLDRYEPVRKAGLGLRIDDLPPTPRSEYVRSAEKAYWRRVVRPGVYSGHIDTTFALYRENSTFSFGPALRTGSPYVARHLPWYEDPDNEDEERRYYRCHADPEMTWWVGTSDRWKGSPTTKRYRWRSRMNWRAYQALGLGEGPIGFIKSPARRVARSTGHEDRYDWLLGHLGWG